MGKDVELADLVGEELSSVCFVRDYVEFGFDGPRLTAYSDPVLLTEGLRFTRSEPGWRDALCRVIGRTVRSTHDEPDHLSLDLGDGLILNVPKYSEDAGAEVAQLIGLDGGKLYLPGMKIWENLRPTKDD